MTRDAEMSATDFVDARAGQHRRRDRRVRRPRDPGVRRPGASHFSAPATGRRCRHLGAGLRELLEDAEPGSDHQLHFVRSFAHAAHSDEALDDLERLLGRLAGRSTAS
jgi:aminopeptidase N